MVLLRRRSGRVGRCRETLTKPPQVLWGGFFFPPRPVILVDTPPHLRYITTHLVSVKLIYYLLPSQNFGTEPDSIGSGSPVLLKRWLNKETC